MFITEDLYLLPNEALTSELLQQNTTIEEVISESESEEEEIIIQQEEPTIKIVENYKPVLFITDKPLSGLSEETFKNLVNKGLLLTESDFALLSQDKVAFSNPEEVNCKKIILFGTSFTGFNQKYKVHTSDKQLILLADSMDKISENVELKRLLWAQLQLIFPK